VSAGSLTLIQYDAFDPKTRRAVFEWLSPEDQTTVRARKTSATPQNQALSISAPISAEAQVSQPQPPEWETPSHKEIDPFDPEYDLLLESVAAKEQLGLIPFVKAATEKGFHVFALTPKDKHPLPGSQGFKDSKAPNDPQVLLPWNEDPTRNIGIDLGASDLCVLDFDKPESIPAWLNEIRTLKVKTAKGVHVYFRGARKTTKLHVDGNVAGDLKSTGGYVLAAGSVHPDGPVYTVIDDSPIAGAPERISELVKHESERVNASGGGPPIPYGSHDTELFRIGCMLRNAGMNYVEVRDALVNICQRRCENHGSDYVDMCAKKAKQACKYPVGQASPMLVFDAAPAAQPPGPAPLEWRSQFRNLSEMEQGDIVMIIDGVLQEGTCFVGANPGNGKTLVALAFAKAICLGMPLFEIAEYTVKQPRKVVYLIPESGDKAFRKRGEAFRLPPDDRFIARTISSGGPLALSDPSLMEAVRQLKPVVILDTASRFLQASDENSAAQNRLLVNDVIALRAAGAVCVIILHHAKKSQSEKREPMTLDNMLRGTSDFGAMCDQAYGIRMDEHLYNRGAGPMEIELVNLKDRERLGGLTSVRLAASYKDANSVFPKSYIDETGNFRPVNFKETRARDEATLNSLVETNPMMSVPELHEATGIKVHTIKETLRKAGWHMAKGGPDGHSPWHKDKGGQCPYEKPKRGANKGPTETVSLEVAATVGGAVN
jgi:Bifunctional DNA primase/polymerase, N-terminal/AAA domain